MLEAGARVDPQFDLARFGTLLLEGGLPSASGRVFDRAIAASGESADLFRKLALARYRSGDADGGVAASRRVIRLEEWSCRRDVARWPDSRELQQRWGRRKR